MADSSKLSFLKGFDEAIRGFISKGFSDAEKDGLKIVVSSLFRFKRALSLLFLSNSVAAFFEGGTIGLLALAVSVLVGESSPTLPVFMGSVGSQINNYLTTFGKEQLFLGLVVIAVSAQVVKAVMLYVGEATQIYLAYGMRRNLQKKLTRHIVYMSYSAVSNYPVGSLTNVIDQSFLVTDVSVQLGNVLRATLMGLAYLAMMVLVSLELALITIVITTALWMTLGSVSRQLRALASKATASQINLWRWTVEYLSSPRLLRLFNSSDYAERRIVETRDLYLFPDRKADLIVAVIPKVLEVVTIVAAAAFLVGGFLIYGERAATVLPALFVYVLIFFRLRPVIKAFNDFRLKLARIRPRLVVISELLSAPIELDRPSYGSRFQGLKKAIIFKDVSFKYPDEKNPVLENINLEVQQGSTLALVGPSGAGKSTIVDLLLGLYTPSEGAILVDTIDLRDLNLFDWRDKIGVVDQEIFLLNTSIMENIRFGRQDSTDEEVKDALRAAYAEKFVEDMADGYDTVIGERGLRLSGGQQQRLALARALLRNPDILILDEATSALDSDSERVIQDTLETIRHDKTIIVIAHRLSTIATADNIAVINNGTVVEYGSRQGLLAGKSEFSRLWSLQVGE